MKPTWTTKATYIDYITGETLDSRTATNKSIYTILKTEKHATFNKQKNRGTIEYIKQCKRNPWQQLELI